MKKSVKKLLSLTLILALGVTLVGCGSKGKESSETNGEDKVIAIGVSPEPHKAIVENAIKPLLEKEGYKVEVVEFSDYVLPNTALAEGEIDANYFQHIPFLEATVKEKSYDLSYTTKVHLEPMGLYSEKIDDISAIKEGAEIAIPNDPSNGARALKLLAKNGVIEIPEGDLVTAKDITSNPKNVNITELDAEQLPRVLQDVELAVINTNYALEGGLNPLKDALVIEGGDSPYANIIAVRTEDKENDKIKALTKAANSEEVKKYIEDNYKGAIVPAF
ncbi:MetQ/NlpA family ABC transporter substrate-binding protein [uncultured Clostridium sp.]|uniref:MetQ/NlpA family ABC transporter substrate-binding protein n=1 Tax=uncultured Clostridium sp. TaxID=59620 RepID=UPI003217EFFC